LDDDTERGLEDQMSGALLLVRAKDGEPVDCRWERTFTDLRVSESRDGFYQSI
jgi:hypothetical protein